MNQPNLGRSDFLKAYAAFRKADPDAVQNALNVAAVQIDADIWAEKALVAQGLLAAHILSLDPLGQATRLKGNTTETVYWKQYEQLRLTLGVGVTVSGSNALFPYPFAWP